MNHINNSLTLTSIQLNAYGTKSEMARSFPAAELFDNRHTFLMDSDQSAIAVLMAFTNERCFSSDNAPGIRRDVSVNLIDVTDGCLLTTKKAPIYMPKNKLMGICRSDLTFTHDAIDTDHTYKVMVRDEKSKEILGESPFRMYDPVKCGCDPEDWFEALKGSFSPFDSNDPFRIKEVGIMTYCKASFQLKANFKETPLIMPEIEVRIYFPDGNIDSRFCLPVCDDIDSNEYHVESPFFIDYNNKGICYVELLCMDFAFAGFVFSTQGETETGYWEDEDLRCLKEYTLSAASERFRKHLAEQESEEEDDNDYFDRLLEEFIKKESEGDFENDESEDADETEGADDTEEANTNVEETDDVEEIEDTDRTDEMTVESPETNTEWSLLSPLDHLSGLKTVKEKLITYEKVVRFNKLRSDCGLLTTPSPLHAMFLGSPGTGKTTVANIIGRILARAGVLTDGHVVVRERATLLGPNYSMEETNTLKAIEEAQGGILLIDEAYQLYQPNDPRDPGKFVIETLISALADESKRNWMLILAGYPDEMRRMFEMNPGLRSRIPDSNIYVFEDFSESELMEIAERYLDRNQYSLSPAAHDALSQRLSYDYAKRDKSFGNARHVVNLIQTDILPAMAVRVMSVESPDSSTLSLIEASDIPAPTMTDPALRPRIGFRA